MSDANPALQARRLLRRGRYGGLATAIDRDDGWPYASMTAFAPDQDASPLFLFSTLADHTRNLADDDRASFLVSEVAGRRNPQTGPRLTLQGRVRRTKDDRAARRYLACHPDAERYAGFGDFGFFRMKVEKAHFVGGFARANWIPARRLMTPGPVAKALAEAERPVLEHMNDDHADAIDLCAQVLLGRKGEGWRMIGVDADGTDLRLGGRVARLAFAEPVTDRAGVRRALVALVEDAQNRA